MTHILKRSNDENLIATIGLFVLLTNGYTFNCEYSEM